MAVLTLIDRYVQAIGMAESLGDFELAVGLATQAIEIDPADARLWRLRGQRYLNTRRFDLAHADLLHGAKLIEGTVDIHEFWPEVDYPDRDNYSDLVNVILGRNELVREQRIPVDEESWTQFKGMYKTTLHISIWYHLAVASFMLERYDEAVEQYRTCLALPWLDDYSIAGSLNWLYLSLRCGGRNQEAVELVRTAKLPRSDFDTVEDTYLRLLKFYRGELDADEVVPPEAEDRSVTTGGFGMGIHYRAIGERELARQSFARALTVNAGLCASVGAQRALDTLDV